MRPANAIKWYRVGIITLTQHLGFAYPGHILDGTVPGDDSLVIVDDEGSIGQEIEDIREQLPGLALDGII